MTNRDGWSESCELALLAHLDDDDEEEEDDMKFIRECKNEDRKKIQGR